MILEVKRVLRNGGHSEVTYLLAVFQVVEQFFGGAVDGGEGGEAGVALRDQALEDALHAHGA